MIRKVVSVKLFVIVIKKAMHSSCTHCLMQSRCVMCRNFETQITSTLESLIKTVTIEQTHMYTYVKEISHSNGFISYNKYVVSKNKFIKSEIKILTQQEL